MHKGTVIGVYIAAAGSASMNAVEEARAVPGKGLEGDRYCHELGTYSHKRGPDRELTLIEMEAIEALRRDYRIEMEPGQTRRNIVTRDIALNHLVGREFRVGEVTLRGLRLCEPCEHLEKLSHKGAMRALLHRGGLRAQIISEGRIRVGDSVEERLHR